MEEKLSVGTSENKPAVSAKRVLLVLATLLIMFGTLFVVHQLISTTIARFVVNTEASGKPFEILSEPPDTAVVGEPYQYLIRIGQFNSPRVYVNVTEKPEWLEWDSQKLKLSGTPKSGDIGQNFVIIKATDTEVSKEQAFSIFVENKTVGDVNGVSDSPGRVSDNEVSASQSCQRYYQELGPLGVLNDHPECNGVYYPTNNGNVLGASDSTDGSGDSEVSAAKVDNRPDILGVKISKSFQIGLLASSAVIVVGLSILIIWLTIMSFKSRRKGSNDNEIYLGKKKPHNLGNQQEGRQQSFINKKDSSQVIIWD